MHTNELWLKNLHSIYREIPVNRLVISDDGCVDDSIEIARKFPRVIVLDHRSFKSLGFSLRKLIENVETEWFVYLHSDVFLSPGWFDHMYAARSSYDWFESAQRTTVMVDIPYVHNRPASGSQMGRRKAFDTVLPQIDDDYLYRNEDIIFAHLITEAGHRYGHVNTTYCHHQLMNKKSMWTRKVESISVGISRSPEEEVREYEMQLYGLLKYLKPNSEDFHRFMIPFLITKMIEFRKLNYRDFEGWVKTVNPGWWIFISQDRNKTRLLKIEERLLSPINKTIVVIKWIIRKQLLIMAKLVRFFGVK